LACLEVLEYRKDVPPQMLTPYVKLFKDDQQVSFFLNLMVAPVSPESLTFLKTGLTSEDEFVFRKSLMALLLCTPTAVSICRELSQNRTISPSRTAFVFRMLAISGIGGDTAYIEKAFLTRPLEIRVAAVESMGYFGLSRYIPHLMNLLNRETDESLKTAIAGTLEYITGAGLLEVRPSTSTEGDNDQSEETTDDYSWVEDFVAENISEEVAQPTTDAEKWNEWWRENHERFPATSGNTVLRYRFGKPLNFHGLVKMMGRFELPADDRNMAAFELAVRSGRNIPFEATWLLSKQQAAIDQWKIWCDGADSESPAHIWQNGGQ
jgi:hypothetical protein